MKHFRSIMLEKSILISLFGSCDGRGKDTGLNFTICDLSSFAVAYWTSAIIASKLQYSSKKAHDIQ